MASTQPEPPASVPENGPLLNMGAVMSSDTRATLPRTSSPSASETSDDNVPSNVSSVSQLHLLPEECLSGNSARPLRHVDEDGRISDYALQPMFYSVIFILLVELLERFSFYGINYTQTSYLTGAYDDDWNAGMEAVPASSYVSISVAVAYTTPFLGAFLADSLLGDYWSVLVGSLAFYLPGLFLIAFTTVPGLLGAEFNRTALAFGLLFLWPVGTGTVKSVVNVFGARQHHPILQSSLIEAYYVKFYMCINVGALVGGILVPMLAQENVTFAYFLPVAMLSLGVLMFTLGSGRYVRSKPKGSLFGKKKKVFSSSGGNDSISLFTIFRISLLIVPFCIAYSQMATTFVVQGTVMRKFGWIDAACMNNADALAVLLFGYLIGSKLYPWMADRNIKIPTTYKFAIGTGFSALSVVWAMVVNLWIRREYLATGNQISVMWQSISYILIGAGEIFAVSAAYEVAFTASPPEKKVLASAVNLFCIGGLPNMICIILYQVCKPWFMNSRGSTSLSKLPDYASAHVGYYFWLLFAIAVGGICLNLLPSVRGFVESIEEKATDMIKTPKTPVRPPIRERMQHAAAADEEASLLDVRRHQAYLKYGSGPVLYKLGSMRAGASIGRGNNNSLRGGSASARSNSNSSVKKSILSQMYRSDPKLPKVMTNEHNQPVVAGTAYSAGTGSKSKGPLGMTRLENPLQRSNSK